MPEANSQPDRLRPRVPETGLRESSVLGLSAGGTTLLLLALLAFVLVISGSYRNYLQDWFGPYLLAAAIAVGMLGLWTLLEAADRSDGRSRERQHSHGIPRIGALLLVPVLLFALSAPNSLGADAVAEVPRASHSTKEPKAFPSLSAETVNEMSILEFTERFEQGDPQLLVGRRVRLLGFVARQRDLPEGQWSINRFRIFCCVADASLYSVAVTGVDQPVGEELWAEVEGVIDLDASRDLPVLVADHVEVTAKPEEPYL